MPLRTCLFDMGNVLVFFSHDRMCEQMGALCGQTGPAMRRLLFDTGAQLDYERGRYTDAAFHGWFQDQVRRTVDLDSLGVAASDIFTLNEPVVPILDGLKRAGIRLVLLSNTSAPHLRFVKSRFDVLDRFDELVVSFEAGAVKPEPAIYEAALRAIDCDPSECFYTDDIPAYVEEGRRHGLDAEVFIGADELRRHLAVRGVPLPG